MARYIFKKILTAVGIGNSNGPIFYAGNQNFLLDYTWKIL